MLRLEVALLNIEEFADHLESALARISIPHDLTDEAAFEEEFVIPIAQAEASRAPGILIYTHRIGTSSNCDPNCEQPREGGRVVGCPKCWTSSKPWGTVSAFGMQHTFDLVAKDEAGDTLAVEVKYIRFSGGGAPNSEFQRFVGQCTIAAARHQAVIGICGLRGKSRKRYEEQQQELVDKCRSLGVRLLILPTKEA